MRATGPGPSGWEGRTDALRGVALIAVMVVVVSGLLALVVPTMAGLGQLLRVIDGPVYSVADLQEGLAVRPDDWQGRPLRVRAVATHIGVRSCPYPIAACLVQTAVLADANGARTTPLPVIWGLSDPWRARVRQWPHLAQVVPPQTVRWGRPAIYRIVLQRLAGPAGYQVDAAVLFDASPVTGL